MEMISFELQFEFLSYLILRNATPSATSVVTLKAGPNNYMSADFCAHRWHQRRHCIGAGDFGISPLLGQLLGQAPRLPEV
jgi:hypothetical protein